MLTSVRSCDAREQGQASAFRNRVDCIVLPVMPMVVCSSVGQQGQFSICVGRAGGVQGTGQDQQVQGCVVAMSCVQGRDVCGQ